MGKIHCMTLSSSDLQKTALYSLHIELGAKMVPFAGYSMPVQYPSGILAEHLHTRDKAGLFDVSHMGQIQLLGKPVAELSRILEKLVPSDIQILKAQRQRYTVLTNEKGGIEDDLIVAHAGNHLHLVVNASNKKADYELLEKHLGKYCQVKLLENVSLLALQGPLSANILQRLGADLTTLPFMGYRAVDLASIPCMISRSGYTGEDGFEISVADKNAQALARLILNFPEVNPIGLGARDTLRLEAGLCLHGQDISKVTTPIEAGLEWVVSKSRRSSQGGFMGDTVILKQLTTPPAKKLVGLSLEGRLPARHGNFILNKQGKMIGEVTSGTFSPTLHKPIALGYVETEYSKPTTPLWVQVREQKIPAVVTALPFVPHRYYRL